MAGLLHILLAVVTLLGGGRQAVPPAPLHIPVPRHGALVGRLIVPRLHLTAPVRQGTAHPQLHAAVGHLESSYLPGMGGDVALFGHRVTPWRRWDHGPLRHIDRLRVGDRVTMVVGWGTYTYRVTGHRVVRETDWSLFRPRLRGDRLLLAACHPPHSSAFRYVVIATLVDESPKRG